MNSLKDNKALQTIVGGGVLYLCFVLWRDGWVAWMFSSDPQDGYNNGQLLVAVAGALLSFVQLVGIATIGVVSGILPQFDGLFDWVAKGIKQGTQWIKDALVKAKNKPVNGDANGEWNWRPLAAIALAFFLWQGGQLERIAAWVKTLIPNVIVEPVEPEGVVFFLDDDVTVGQQDVAYSTLVDDYLDSKDVERRLYSLDQDLGTEEDWVAKACEAATDGACMVIWDGKTATVKEIPGSIEAFKEATESW